jgi:hypothetical protein
MAKIEVEVHEQMAFDFSDADKRNNVQPLIRAWPLYEERIRPLVTELERAANLKDVNTMRAMLVRINDEHIEIYAEIGRQVFAR